MKKVSFLHGLSPLSLTLPREGGGNKIRAAIMVVLLLLAAAQPSLAEDALNLTPTQLDSLGVRFAAPQAVSAAQGSAWSGMVSVPPQGFEQVVAPLAGRVVKVSAAAGVEVKYGQVLLTIYSPELVVLTQKMHAAENRVLLAEQTLARERRLLKEGIGIERKVREAELAWRQALSESGAAGMLFVKAGGSMDYAQYEADLRVRATSEGRVLSFHALPGAWLAAGDVVASLSSTKTRWVEVNVPVSVANNLREGQAAKVDMPGGEGLTGRVLAIGAVVDAALQTVMVRVTMDDAEVLRPGLRVSLRFDESKAQDLWRVPKSALVQVDGALSVFVKRNDRLLPLAVTSQGMSDAQPAIRADFSAGDAVAVEGAILLKGAWDGRAASGAGS